MQTYKLIISSVAALGLCASAHGQVVSQATGVASNVANTTIDGAKGLLSLPSKSLSFGDSALPDLSAGTQEFGLSGRVGFQDDFDATFTLSYGYFFKDNWQVGFVADAILREGSASTGNGDSLSAALFTEYNFDLDSKWVPYVGASVGLGSVSSTGTNGGGISGDGIEISGVFGVKYFLTQNIAISGGVDFSWNSSDALDTDIGGDVNIGTRFYF